MNQVKETSNYDNRTKLHIHADNHDNSICHDLYTPKEIWSKQRGKYHN